MVAEAVVCELVVDPWGLYGSMDSLTQSWCSYDIDAKALEGKYVRVDLETSVAVRYQLLGLHGPIQASIEELGLFQSSPLG